MTISHQIEKNICIFCVDDDLTKKNIHEFKAIVEDLCLENDDITGIIIDLQQVKQLDSTSIAEITILGKQLDQIHKKLAFCFSDWEIANLLTLARLDKIASFHLSKEEALNTVSQET